MEPKKINVIVASYENYPVKKFTNLPRYLSKKDYKELLKTFFEKLAYYIITSGDQVILPGTMGALQAVKFKCTKFKPKNYSTKKTGKISRHTFISTDGYWTRIHWSRASGPFNRYGARFKHSRNFTFSFIRRNMRKYNHAQNARVCLYDFFRKEGWMIYKEL